MFLTDFKIQSETDYLSFLVYTSLSDLASPEAKSDEQGEKEFPIISSASPNTKWLKTSVEVESWAFGPFSHPSGAVVRSRTVKCPTGVQMRSLIRTS